MTTDFWAKRREQLQQQNPQPQPRQEPVRNAPWWDDTGTITQQGIDKQQQDPYTVTTGQPQQDEHDYSKATHLKSRAGSCPNCGSGNYVKPSATIATRCFDCGYVEGRQVNDLDTFVALQDAKTIQVKQADSAHGIRLGSSPDKNQIAMANAELEASANGKTRIA